MENILLEVVVQGARSISEAMMREAANAHALLDPDATEKARKGLSGLRKFNNSC
jgi:hypothetical protein